MTPTGPGRVHAYRISGAVQAALYNFDIDGYELKPEHTRFLDAKIIPLFRQGGRAAILAQTSRTATHGHNDLLSRARERSVTDYLRTTAGQGVSIYRSRAVGETNAEQRGQPDEHENDWYRSVLVLAGRPTPPPPRPQPPSAPQIPCQYYDFEIAWITGLTQAWAMSMGSTDRPGAIWEEAPGEGVSAGPQFVFYAKPEREHFLVTMGIAMARHFHHRRISTAQLLQMYEWYRGEAMPNGGYEFINNSHERLRRLRALRQAGDCSGDAYTPPCLRRAGDPPPMFVPPPPADRRGRMY